MSTPDEELIVYKRVDGIALTLAVDSPAGDEAAPVVIYMHGGGWSGGSEVQFKPFAARLAACGIAGVRINYRKIPQGATVDKTLSDCFDAVEWVREHARAFRFDLTRLALAGASAGGLLAGLVSQKTPECIAYLGCNPAVDLIDFGETSVEPQELLQNYFGGTDECLRKASPIHNLREVPPTTLLLHGECDRVVDPRTVLRYAEVVRARGADVQVEIFPGEAHGFFNAGRPAYEQSYSLIKAFLQKVFG